MFNPFCQIPAYRTFFAESDPISKKFREQHDISIKSIAYIARKITKEEMQSDPTITMALVALILLGTGFSISFGAEKSGAIAGWYGRRFAPRQASGYLFMFRKITGFISFGLFPAIIFSLFYGYTPAAPTDSTTRWEFLVLLLLAALIAAVSYKASSKEDVYTRVPQLAVRRWSWKEVMITAFGWAIYLLGYEFMFRELFLFTWAEAFGAPVAVAANLVVYALVHILNGRKETLGTLPFGLVLCLISLQTGSFMAAWALHLTLSLSASLFSVYHHPNMSFNFIKK
jgi:membrane protease YdiL (CAAX protease family)